MSAFAVIYDPSGTPVEPGALERVMARLSHRGPDGSDTVHAPHASLGHWHFWTTPEEVGERQPLRLDGFPFRIVFDGRLDNRGELLPVLGLDDARARSISDSALILHAYDRWGEACFERFVGEYALAILDERRGALVCARDALGDRTLFYAVEGTRWIIASEPWAATAGSSVEIDECALAHYFALRPPPDGRTLFRNVFELLPAQVMTITETGVRKRFSWQPDPSNRLRGLSDMEYAARFFELLKGAVRSRMRASTPVGVLMSGGLDSTSIACFAAWMCAPVPLTTITYVFDELTDCDERQYIQTMIDRWGIRSLHVPGDDAWPLRDWDADAWPRNPNHPEGNPYRLLKERSYHLAHTEGLRVLMPGSFGDELYDGEEDWLADLLFERRWREGGAELWRHVKYAGLGKTLRSVYLRRAVRRILLPFVPRRRLVPPPNWLTPFAAGQLRDLPTLADPVFANKTNIIGLEAAWNGSREIVNANRHAVELRHPYHDLRLVEFALSLPAHQLYNRGYPKYILRNAMQDTLPEAILSRQGPTPLFSLYERGMERERARVDTELGNDRAIWRKYIRADRVARRRNMTLTPENDGAEALLPWLCLSVEAWLRSAPFRVETE